MAKEQDHNPITGRGLGETAAQAGYPAGETDYWREAYAREPYYEGGRSFEEYSPAYELGWYSYAEYGSDIDAADRSMAGQWEQRRGTSTLPWDEARAAARAAWRRAENAQAFVTDGSATPAQVLESLNDLVENARDSELGFREAAEHTKSPELGQLFRRRAESARLQAAELEEQIQRLGGSIEKGGTVSGAAHRVWTHIRGLFGGASDETMLNECERGEDATLARYRKALMQNLPHPVHAMVRRQFEDAQGNHDMIKSLRDRARAETKAKTDSDA